MGSVLGSPGVSPSLVVRSQFSLQCGASLPFRGLGSFGPTEDSSQDGREAGPPGK